MCDINKNNFDKRFPEIEKSILNSDFVSLDSEFTGIFLDHYQHKSRFDDAPRRFKKILSGSKDSLIIQLGVTTFKFDSQMKAYKAKSWNFNVFPKFFGPIDYSFKSSSSSIKFLLHHNFDFNECFRNGLSFTSDVDEERLNELFKNNVFSEGLSISEKDELDELCMDLSDPNFEELVIECKVLDSSIIHAEIRRRFKDLWSFEVEDDPQKVLIKKVDEFSRSSLEKMYFDSNKLKENLMKRLKGVSRLITVLRKSGKPIVGHNCMLDFIKIYHQFISPLSDDYEKFKTSCRKEFPIIFDTKLLADALKKSLSDKDLKDARKLLLVSQLCTLYEKTNGHLKDVNVLFEPVIVLEPGFQFSTDPDNNPPFHLAGYDSFITGKVFLILAQISSSILFQNYTISGPLNFSEHFNSIETFRNKMFASQSSFPYYDLENKEKKDLSIVHMKCKNQTMSCTQVANILSRYGKVEVKSYLRRRYIVACPNSTAL